MRSRRKVLALGLAVFGCGTPAAVPVSDAGPSSVTSSSAAAGSAPRSSSSAGTPSPSAGSSHAASSSRAHSGCLVVSSSAEAASGGPVAAEVPPLISVGGFTIPVPPAGADGTLQAGIDNLPHPTVAAGALCTGCHASPAGWRNARGYDHASPLINAHCNACHEAAPSAGGAGSNDLLGSLWCGATDVHGAGDSRPFTLLGVVPSFRGYGGLCTVPNHFYPTDCAECHTVPAGNGRTTTGAEYVLAWKFRHSEGPPMTKPATCNKCHAAPCNIPN